MVRARLLVRLDFLFNHKSEVRAGLLVVNLQENPRLNLLLFRFESGLTMKQVNAC